MQWSNTYSTAQVIQTIAEYGTKVDLKNGEISYQVFLGKTKISTVRSILNTKEGLVERIEYNRTNIVTVLCMFKVNYPRGNDFSVYNAGKG